MYRQSPSRSQRSKGIKTKHVLQICLLLAVCFWLMYQVKHSHDKKKEFDENDATNSLRTGTRNEILTLGRKDLRPRVEETVAKNEKHDEAAEQEATEEEELEEDKHEEDKREIKKAEQKDDEEMGGGDEEINEHEHEKSDADTEADGEEEFVDEDKDRDEGGENDMEEKDSEESDGELEKEGSLEDNDHDGDERSAHEAREEQYKADDASSAVAHENQIVDPENENGSLEHIKELPETNISERESEENNGEEINLGDKRTDLEMEGGKIAKRDNQSSGTPNESKENLTGKSENSALANTTLTEESNHMESNISSEVKMEGSHPSMENGTVSKLELNNSQRVTVRATSEEAINSTLGVDSNHGDSNSTTSGESRDLESSTGKFSGSSNNSESSVKPGNNTESSTVNIDDIEAEKSDTKGGTDEFSDKTFEEVNHDPIDSTDSSNSLVEKDVRTDLETLPEIETAGTNIEDAAAAE